MYFGWFDPMYLVFVGPALLFAAWAQVKVKSAFARGSKHAASCGLTGAEAARRILAENGIDDVAVESVRSFLGDHYDPTRKRLRLSPDVYAGRSLSALGVAAHEAGHAIQHAERYAPLAVRGALVPTASFGDKFAIILVFLGWIFQSAGLALAGLVLFAVVVLFQLVNLPVEFNASRRARAVLIRQGLVSQQEERVVANVLNAAAMTYVAATISAILTLLYYAWVLFGRRD